MDFLLTFAVEKCELFLSENIANMTKIKKNKTDFERQASDRQRFLNEVIHYCGK